MSTKNTKLFFAAGETIMQQGDEGTSAYIIEEGRVEIVLERPDGRKVNVGTRGEGSIVGEMAIVDDSPRVASVIAVEDCKMLEITKEDFSKRLDSTDPIIQMISQVILTRYRDMLKRAKILGAEQQYPPPEALEKRISHHSDAVEAVRISNELGKALENDDLEVHYQPLIDLKSGKIKGAEALLRWTHDELGFISPGLFIPIAETTGQITDVTRWVLDKASHGLEKIKAAMGANEDLYISINFSSYDFARTDFVEHLLKTIDECHLNTSEIVLEITERVLIQQPDQAKIVLEACHNRGIRIALDDFGTGYSSLSYLHYFPIDILKVDQSFVQNIEEDKRTFELVKSIIGLGKNMELEVIAEGVETEAQARKLIEAECDSVQGYFFAKPMAEADFISTLENWSSPLK